MRCVNNMFLLPILCKPAIFSGTSVKRRHKALGLNGSGKMWKEIASVRAEHLLLEIIGCE